MAAAWRQDVLLGWGWAAQVGQAARAGQQLTPDSAG